MYNRVKISCTNVANFVNFCAIWKCFSKFYAKYIVCSIYEILPIESYNATCDSFV